MKQELKARGFSDDDIFDITPQRAREILADPNCTAFTERYSVGEDTSEVCLVCQKADAKMIGGRDRCGQYEAKPLHPECAPKWFESHDLPLEDHPDRGSPMTETEAEGTTASVRYGSPLDYHGPVVELPELPGDPLDEHGAPAEAAPADIPPPSDPVERWRTCFARLDPRRDPCAGFDTGDWTRIHGAGSTFLAGPFVKQAIAAGWTERELFGVHPAVGIARSDACGALMSSRGVPVTQVTPLLIRFANGLAVYKARLSVGDSVAVWDYREPAANGSPFQVSPPRPQ
jgi:hypothetical protein